MTLVDWLRVNGFTAEFLLPETELPLIEIPIKDFDILLKDIEKTVGFKEENNLEVGVINEKMKENLIKIYEKTKISI